MVAPGALGPAAATNLMMPALEAYSAAAMREYDAAAGRLHQEASRYIGAPPSRPMSTVASALQLRRSPDWRKQEAGINLHRASELAVMAEAAG